MIIMVLTPDIHPGVLIQEAGLEHLGSLGNPASTTLGCMSVDRNFSIVMLVVFQALARGGPGPVHQSWHRNGVPKGVGKALCGLGLPRMAGGTGLGPQESRMQVPLSYRT